MGALIAFGHLLRPPYRIVQRTRSVTANGRVVFQLPPRDRTPQSPLGRFCDRIRDRYWRLVDRSGDIAARTAIGAALFDEIDSPSGLISGYEWRLDETILLQLREGIDLDLILTRVDSSTRQENRELIETFANRLRTVLDAGHWVVLGKTYFLSWPEEASTREAELLQIARSDLEETAREVAVLRAAGLAARANDLERGGASDGN